MTCIFCKQDSSSSKSVEHIIPESLGNKSHILPKGAVCDSCNNYFATKIEKELLSSGYFKSLRYRNDIPNKRGITPLETAIIAHPSGGKIEVDIRGNIIEAVIPSKRIFDLVNTGTVRRLYIPIYQNPEPNNSIVSRFICKVALEALAQRFSQAEGWNEEIVSNKSLNPIRDYARYGKGSKLWEYSCRKIYDENFPFTEGDKKYQVLHEYDFIFIRKEAVFICAILGIEYAINLGGDSIENYTSWLKASKGVSPLLMDHSQKVKHNQANHEGLA